MAKNWTVKEAYDAIVKGDKEAIADIGKRYPMVLAALAKGDVGVIIGGIPDYVTARKMNDVFKGDVEDVESDTDSDDETLVKKGKKAPQSEDEKRAKAKARREARKAKKEAEEVEEDDEEVDDEPEEVDDEPDYSSMNAIELYKLCKKRGLKPEQKQKPAVYIKMLKAADEQESEDDDWEDEEEEAPAPVKKKAGRPPKNATKKVSAKKDEPEEDDDDEWDI